MIKPEMTLKEVVNTVSKTELVNWFKEMGVKPCDSWIQEALKEQKRKERDQVLEESIKIRDNLRLTLELVEKVVDRLKYEQKVNKNEIKIYGKNKKELSTIYKFSN
jgi:thymidylate synthase